MVGSNTFLIRTGSHPSFSKIFTLESADNEVRLRVQKMQATSYARAVSVLNDVRKKLDSANQLLNNASEAHDDAFEVTADQLLEQAAKQLDAVENGINSFRADLKNLRANI